MPYCCECGKEIEKDKLFCEECHKKIYSTEDEVSKKEDDQINKPSLKIEEKPVVNKQNYQHELISEVVPAKNNYELSREELNKMDKGPWKVFAIIGYVHGIVAIFAVLIPFCFPFSIGLAIEGFIFSMLGKKSINQEQKASTGISLCLAAFFISILVGTTCIMCTYDCIEEVIQNYL